MIGILAQAAATVESSLMNEALKGLIAAGPVALVLGVLCWALWKQNIEKDKKLERQHAKTLKLAVRVQRAVEIIAGVEHEKTEVERVEEEDENEAKKRQADEDN